LILAIDTSSARSALALIRPDGTTAFDSVAWPLDDQTKVAMRFDLPARVRELGRPDFTMVAVAIGPGSFTGTRVGVSFGLGLAMGLRIPIVPLRSLEIQAVRADEPVTAVSEAGRGRLYHLAPGASPGIGEPADVPRGWPLVGWLRPATTQALASARHEVLPEANLKSFGAAAAVVLKTAREVAYGSLKLEYMQSFAGRM
jgi:tRNA threonylcarbamoyl adenosine modification protein YeaZ